MKGKKKMNFIRNGTIKKDHCKYVYIRSSIDSRRKNMKEISHTGTRNNVYLLMFDSNEEKLSFYTLNFTADDG